MKELLAIQTELKTAKSKYNKFGKYHYRSLEDIMESLKPYLKKHNLLLYITDDVKETSSWTYIEAIVRLEKVDDSSNFVEVRASAGVTPNPAVNKMDVSQAFGSSSSYARKYALNGLFLIDDTKDADATNDHGTKPLSQEPTPIKKKPELKPDTEAWTKAIDFMVKGGLISKVEAGYALTEVNKQLLMDTVLDKA